MSSAQTVLHDVKPQPPLAAAADAAGGAAGATGWRALEGKSMAEQERSLAPGGPGSGGTSSGSTAPKEKKPIIGATMHKYGTSKGDGAATLVSTVPSYSMSGDRSSMTERFLEVKEQVPGANDAELWRVAALTDANAGGDYGELRNPKAGAVPTGGRKVAAVIGNANYAHWDDLPGAARDAAAMTSHYRGKGYQVISDADVKGAALIEGATQAAAELKRGDEFVFYFAGHGYDQAIVGVDAPMDLRTIAGTVLPFAQLAALAGDAVAKGYGAQIIIDACGSGGLQEEVEKNQAETHGAAAMPVDAGQLAGMQSKYSPDMFKAKLEKNEELRRQFSPTERD